MKGTIEHHIASKLEGARDGNMQMDPKQEQKILSQGRRTYQEDRRTTYVQGRDRAAFSNA